MSANQRCTSCFQAASNHQRQPEKEKPFGIQPSGFLLDGLAFRLPNLITTV
ncbi:hypothetical protein [Kingella oralis]|uniref:hypothetical protein n=1 Tax=Kingella oralis TaxID=505 RepID=UPI0034E5DB66